MLLKGSAYYEKRLLPTCTCYGVSVKEGQWEEAGIDRKRRIFIGIERERPILIIEHIGRLNWRGGSLPHTPFHNRPYILLNRLLLPVRLSLKAKKEFPIAEKEWGAKRIDSREPTTLLVAYHPSISY